MLLRLDRGLEEAHGRLLERRTRVLFEGASAVIFPRERGELRIVVSLARAARHPGPRWVVLFEQARILLPLSDPVLRGQVPFPDMPLTGTVVAGSTQWDEEQFAFTVRPANERASRMFAQILAREEPVVQVFDQVSIELPGGIERVELLNRGVRGHS